ncbi:hypothetical protein DFH09DRAFT_1422067, partial [Mycena vulgaris]
MLELAQELIDQVIDWCHLADPDTMKPCGLVCTQWLPRTRYHLFFSATLSTANLASFVDLIDASSVKILYFIRKLRL